jgi:hypothetical protein
VRRLNCIIFILMLFQLLHFSFRLKPVASTTVTKYNWKAIDVNVMQQRTNAKRKLPNVHSIKKRRVNSTHTIHSIPTLLKRLRAARTCRCLSYISSLFAFLSPAHISAQPEPQARFYAGARDCSTPDFFTIWFLR